MEVIYFFISIITLYISLIKNNEKSKKILIFFNFIICTYLLFNVRMISPDYSAYKTYYLDAINTVPYYNYEIGFRMLNKLLYFFFRDKFSLVFLSYYIIIIYLYSKAIKYYCKNNISIEILFLLIIMNQILLMSTLIRQFIAVGIVFFCSKYIIDKQKIKFFIGIIIAGLFHFTAFIFLLAFIIYILIFDWKKNKNYIFISIFLLLIVLLFEKDRLIYKINKYFITTNQLGSIDFGAVAILFLVLFVLSSILIVKFDFKKKLNIYLISLGTIYYMLFFLFINHGFVNRISLYFQPFVYVVISKAPLKFKNNLLINILLILLFVLGFIILMKKYII